MASIQDIQALEERIYDAVQEYLDNPDGYENAVLHVYLDDDRFIVQRLMTICKAQKMMASTQLRV